MYEGVRGTVMVSRGRILHGEEAAICGRVDGPDDEGDNGDRRRYVRRAAGFVLRASEGIGGRGNGFTADRDQPGYAEHKSGYSGNKEIFKRDWNASSLPVFGNDRADGIDAGGADGGSDVGIAAPCASDSFWGELRHRAGVHDGSHPDVE